MPRTIAVTGVSGYVGRTLLGLLERSPDVERVIGLDTREIPIRTPKIEFHTFDVLDPGLDKMVEGADTLVHLAFCVNPMRDEALMHEVNVGGFRCVLDAVEAAGVSRFVYVSSGSAYGAHLDNPVPLTEDNELRPNPGFSYAEHKAETEAILRRWHQDHPEVAVTVLRPAVVLGPHVDNFMSRALEGPRLWAVQGYEPPLQFLHEDDLAAALQYFVLGDHPGTYNLCADGWMAFSEVARLVGRKQVVVPEDVAFPIADVAWKTGIADAPAGELNLVMYPCVLSNAKAREAGWHPGFSNEEIVEVTAETHVDHVTVGTIRMTRSTYEKSTRAAALALATGAAVALIALLRRLTR